jgi:hypothetical protein
MAIKVDFKKTLKDLYNPGKRGFHIVQVPTMKFLMVDGIGNPNTSIEYQQAVEALYTLSYGISLPSKFKAMIMLFHLWRDCGGWKICQNLQPPVKIGGSGR